MDETVTNGKAGLKQFKSLQYLAHQFQGFHRHEDLHLQPLTEMLRKGDGNYHERAIILQTVDGIQQTVAFPKNVSSNIQFFSF